MIFPSFIVYHNIRQHRDNLNLQTISYLKKNYPQYKIGFSDHTIGISAPIVALGLGAEIIEKHITIDRRMKGTDQAWVIGAGWRIPNGSGYPSCRALDGDRRSVY